MIYLDESGATGNNVADLEQPIFVMAAVNIDPEEAQELVASFRAEIKAQGPELKAAKILKSERGLKATERLLGKLRGRATSVAYDKLFSVYLRIYDYVLDEIDHSFAKYMIDNAHRAFAIQMLQDERSGDRLATQIRDAMISALWEGDTRRLESLLQQKTTLRSSVSASLHRIMVRHAEATIEAVSEFRSLPETGKWLLEPSLPGIHWNCAYWSKRARPLNVTADESKPNLGQRTVLEEAIRGTGRTTTVDDPDFHWPVDVASISLEDSKKVPGLQLADIVAGTTVHALRFGTLVSSVRPMLIFRASVLEPRTGLPPVDPLMSKKALKKVLEKYE